jgi:hypothetical protein
MYILGQYTPLPTLSDRYALAMDYYAELAWLYFIFYYSPLALYFLQ